MNIELREEFENKHNVEIFFFNSSEIFEKYGIEEDDIESHVINYNKQTLPIDLMVIEKEGKPYIFHAKNAFFIEDLFLEAVNG